MPTTNIPPAKFVALDDLRQADNYDPATTGEQVGQHLHLFVTTNGGPQPDEWRWAEALHLDDGESIVLVQASQAQYLAK